jgi:peptidoglycan/xylan/chitin deacetylase (PgdA/CDA1 family)
MSYAFMCFPGYRELAFTLSYDDGVPADSRLVDMFNRYGLKATFNLNGGTANEVGRLPIEEAKALYLPNGHEVAVHGAHHYSLGEIPDTMVMQEVFDNRRALENTFGVIVKGMAYANGSFDDRVVELLKDCGINYARTCVTTERFDIPSDWLRLPATCHHNNPRLMQLAETFLQGGNKRHFFYHKPFLFYVWGHSYEFDRDDNWDMMEDFCKFIGGREDIWYATNGEIYDYVKAYDSLIYSADGGLVKNPSCIDVYIKFLGKPYVVPAGKTVALEIRL